MRPEYRRSSTRALERIVLGDDFIAERDRARAAHRRGMRREVAVRRRMTGGVIAVVLASISGMYLTAGAAPGGSKGRHGGPATTTTVASVATTTTAAPATTTTAATSTTTAAPTTTIAPTTFVSSTTTATTAPTAPSTRSMYWGAWIGSQLTGAQPPWDMNAVSAFANITGKSPSLLNWGSPFYSATSCSGYCPFVAANFESVRNSGAIPFFSWGSNPGTGAFTDAQIAAGSQDSYITAWATAAKNWGHPLFLRFNWEMNGSWMNWGVGANGNTATDYVAMWRHVYQTFEAAGATNVSWVWCPNIDTYDKLTPLSEVYPGDGYVDWTCMDGYNWGTNPAGNASGWQTFDQMYHSTYHNIVDTVAPTKPLIIGEVASTEYGGSKASWISDMLTVQLPQNYPRVGGVLWFEKQGAEGDGMDWDVESSTTAATAFHDGIAAADYRSNSYASLGGTVIPPP